MVTPTSRGQDFDKCDCVVPTQSLVCSATTLLDLPSIEMSVDTEDMDTEYAFVL